MASVSSADRSHGVHSPVGEFSSQWTLVGRASFTGFYWVLLGFNGFYWVLLGYTGLKWVILDYDEF